MRRAICQQLADFLVMVGGQNYRYLQLVSLSCCMPNLIKIGWRFTHNQNNKTAKSSRGRVIMYVLLRRRRWCCVELADSRRHRTRSNSLCDRIFISQSNSKKGHANIKGYLIAQRHKPLIRINAYPESGLWSVMKWSLLLSWRLIRYLTRKVSSKSVHNFWSYLVHIQTSEQKPTRFVNIKCWKVEKGKDVTHSQFHHFCSLICWFYQYGE